MNLLQHREERRQIGAGTLIVIGLLTWLFVAMLPDLRRYLRIHSM